MAFLGGLLGGGGSDIADIYGDLFTEKQRAALRDQQMTQGLLNAAAVFSKAGQASRLPVSIPWGEAAQALGGSGDEAMNRMLKGMQVAEEVRGSRQTREWQTKLNQMLMPIWQKQMAMGQPLNPSPASVGATPPAAPGAPAGGPPASNAPPPPPAGGALTATSAFQPEGPTGRVPPSGGSAPGAEWLPTLPPRAAGLLDPAAYGGSGGGLPGQGVLASLGGGEAGVPLPFGQGSPGSPDLSNIKIEQLSGEAAPAGSRPAPGDRSDAAWEYYKPIIKKLESGNRNIEQQVVPRGGGYNPSTGTVTGWSSASSPLQMLDSTFQGTARKAGIDVSQYPRAMNAPEAIQDEVGKALFKERGLQPWAAYNAPLARATGYDGPMANAGRSGGSGFSGRIEQLGGEAAPAGTAPSGTIPGLGMTPEALATLNALMKVNKLGSPFDSLLETYYKSPGYLAEKARTEAQATKGVALQMDPLIAAQTKAAEAKVELEWKPKIEEAVQKLQSPILKEREQAKADIDRISEELKQNRNAAFTQTDATVFGPGGVVGTQKMTALEFAQRQQARAERVARGDTSLQPGDIVAAPIGAAPAGHQYIMTPQGTLSALPVPGTPEAQKAADAVEKKAEAQYQALQHRDIVVGNADRIEGMIAGAILPTTGAAGSWLSNLGGTAANNIRGAVDTLKARLSIDEINRIRNSNPTGAAFGNLTEKEGERVASAAANLDQSQTQDEFLYNLRVAKQIYIDATTRAKLSDEAVLKVPRSTTAAPPTIGGTPPGGTAPRERRWNPKTGRLE